MLFWRLGPYHHARLNNAGATLHITGIEACGIEDMYAWSKVEGADKFDKITVTERFLDHPSWARQMRLRLWSALDRIQPDVVAVPGWSLADALAALHWCVRTMTPVVVMSDSTAWSGARGRWREWLKSRLLRHCTSALVAGTPHAEYLVDLGMPKERVFLGYDVVDNDHFAEKSAEVRSQEPECRKLLGLPKKYFLASARFVEVKNLPRLLRAYARYRDLASLGQSGKRDREIWDLVLTGDGPLRESLNSQLSTLNLHKHVHLPGFKQYDELPAYYALASAFVHASITETWALVVNEAMASGLPVLVSNGCGCARDLVQEGLNGFTFNPYEIEQLAQLMLKLSTLDSGLIALGSASREIIGRWGLDRFAAGLKQAVDCAMEVTCPRSDWVGQILVQTVMYRGRYA